MGVRRKFTALAVGTVVASAGFPAAATAEKGLTVDPQSPAGVEYAVPLDSARGHGGGSGGSGGSPGGANAGGTGSAGNGSPALFGSGITPSSSSKGSGSGAGSAHGKSGARQKGAARKPGAGTSTGSATGTSRPSGTPVTASASYSTTGPIAGVIAAILIVGGGLGLFLRLRARRPAGVKPPR
jgi:hypothetical protein